MSNVGGCVCRKLGRDRRRMAAKTTNLQPANEKSRTSSCKANLVKRARLEISFDSEAEEMDE